MSSLPSISAQCQHESKSREVNPEVSGRIPGQTTVKLVFRVTSRRDLA